MSKGRRPSVFERLNDPSNYTGVYFERFRTQNGHINANASSGNVNHLQEILRPSVRSSTCVHIGKGWDAGQHTNSGFVHDTPATRSNPFGTSTSSSSAIPLKTKEVEDTIRRRMSLSSPMSCYTPSRSASPFFSSLPHPNNDRSPPSQSIRRPSSALNSREIVKSLLLNNNNNINNNQHRIKHRSPSPSLITNLRDMEDNEDEVVKPIFREEKYERVEKPQKRAATPVFQNQPIVTNIEKAEPPSISNKSKTQKQISVFERLNDKQNFTGVYKERFESGIGSINGSSEYYDNENNHSSIPDKRVKPRPSSASASRQFTADHISVSLNQYQKSPPLPTNEKKKKKSPKAELNSPKSPSSPDWTNYYRGSYKDIASSKQNRERS